MVSALTAIDIALFLVGLFVLAYGLIAGRLAEAKDTKETLENRVVKCRGLQPWHPCDVELQAKDAVYVPGLGFYCQPCFRLQFTLIDASKKSEP